jgi:hypothetical protein
VSRKLRVGVTVIVVLFAGYLLWNAAWTNTGYSPEQPIPYSHKLHAGTYHIPCLYCHTYAERSPNAVVPALNVCMNCHSVVAVNKPNIMKLTEAYNSGKTIPWVRIHKVPEHVRFDHSRHMAKGFACQKCHGPVETMDRVYQYRPLNMGDCLNCHRQNGGPTICNTCHQ